MVFVFHTVYCVLNNCMYLYMLIYRHTQSIYIVHTYYMLHAMYICIYVCMYACKSAITVLVFCILYSSLYREVNINNNNNDNNDIHMFYILSFSYPRAKLLYVLFLYFVRYMHVLGTLYYT